MTEVPDVRTELDYLPPQEFAAHQRMEYEEQIQIKERVKDPDFSAVIWNMLRVLLMRQHLYLQRFSDIVAHLFMIMLSFSLHGPKIVVSKLSFY